jgi:O-methyltransferase involved in polyketide biosynthesis
MDNLPDTLLIPLVIRAQETKREHPMLQDIRAVELCQKLHLDDRKLKQAQVSEEVQLSLLLRNRHFDEIVVNFLNVHPHAIIVYLGCGLDARFERLDNGSLTWYDLDLPEVISYRQVLLGEDTDRHKPLAYSALDDEWMNEVRVDEPGQILIIAEGLFMFFQESQVRYLILELKARFPGSELAFDAFSPFYMWGNNRRVNKSNIGAMVRWGLKHPTEIEAWSEGVKLLDEWYPFLTDEPRLAHIRWVKFIPLLAKTTGVFHYRLE